MAKKQITLDGKSITLPDFVSLTKVRGESKFVLTWHEDGAVKRKYFPFTSAGLKDVKTAAVDKNRERKQYGSAFGNITEDEKRAIEEFRKYKRDCEFNGIKPKSMFDVISETLKTVSASTPTFKYLADAYLANMNAKKTLSKIHVTCTTGALKKLSDFFGQTQIHQLRESDFDDFISTLVPRKGELSAAAKKKYLTACKSVLEYAVKKDIIESEYNFLKHTIAEKPKRVEPSVLSVDDAKKLMCTLKNNAKLHKYIPMVVLGLFCGVRNQERCRLKYADLYVGGRNEIFLSCEVTKTSLDRVIYPSENVKSWLDFARNSGIDMSSDSFICDGNTEDERVTFNAMFQKNIKKAGIVLPKNVLRHSAASYMCELQGFTATSTQLGHTEQILRQHYRRALTKQDAQEFFNITPDNI